MGIARFIGPREATLLAVIGVAIVAFATLSPVYLSVNNLNAVIRNSTELLAIALGLTFVMAIGGIDVSIGVAMGIAAIAIGKLLMFGIPSLVAAAAGPVVGVTLGAVTGAVIVYGRIPAIVATIGLLGIFRMVVFALLGGSWLSGLPSGLSAIFTYKLGGLLPVSYIFILAAYLVAFAIFRLTPLGTHLLAIGNSEERARLSGIAINRVRMAAYLICGGLAGMAATFYIANYRNVETGVGTTLAMDAIAAVVLGGTSIMGGRASLLGTVLGVFLIRILQNGFTIVGLPSLWQPVVTGGVLILSLIAEQVVSGLRRRTRTAPSKRAAA